jgi:beta-lactamase class D
MALAGSQRLEAVLAAAGVAGSFALLDLATDRLELANPARAGVRRIPASTFKIANALIALETGVVADERAVIPYGGKPQPFPAWEQDMTLGAAMAASNVAVYQEVARRVGLVRYAEWLDTLGYGNAAVGTAVDRFWLDGPLKISPIEQCGFLAALSLGQLPMSARAQGLVREMMLVPSSGPEKIYAKTGWLTSVTPNIGWWVGWVENGDRKHTFALEIDLPTTDSLAQRALVGKALLKAAGVLQGAG